MGKTRKNTHAKSVEINFKQEERAMEPLTIIIASTLAAKILDELAAKSKNRKLRKYLGIFSWLAKLPGIFKTRI